MDGFRDIGATGHDPVANSVIASLGGAFRRPSYDGLIERRLDALQTLVVTKLAPGFDDSCVDSLRRIVEDVACGRRGALKFLVLDFAHQVQRDSIGGDGFHRLVHEAANLILRAPIVSVACVRADMAGADLELALACSMMISETGRRFSFTADPALSLATYGFLSHKIGFVRAERLMDRSDSVDAGHMHDLLLVKSLMEPGAGFAAVEQFLARTARRHNACYGIYRAHRMASPAIEDSQIA